MAAVIENVRERHRVWAPVEGYNLVAPVYDHWHWRPFWLKNESPYIEEIVRRTGTQPRRSLDLGCGTGTYCSILGRYGEVVGVDPAVEMLKVARRRAPSAANLICGSASAIPLDDESVGMTIAARSLCHESDLAKAFQELARVTVRGGTCILSEVHAQHDYPRTRIPFGSDYVYIRTFKRLPREIIEVASAGTEWQVEHVREMRWEDLAWQPNDDCFNRIDQSNKRPIFYVMELRRC
jgi:ubiquinone/menaquinone biosynthesis C-methylase UbiE